MLLLTFGIATAYTLAASEWPVLKSFPVFSWIGLPGVTAWGWELSPSLGYVGQGMIMGPRSAVSMLLGAIAGTHTYSGRSLVHKLQGLSELLTVFMQWRKVRSHVDDSRACGRGLQCSVCVAL